MILIGTKDPMNCGKIEYNHWWKILKDIMNLLKDNNSLPKLLSNTFNDIEMFLFFNKEQNEKMRNFFLNNAEENTEYYLVCNSFVFLFRLMMNVCFLE